MNTGSKMSETKTPLPDHKRNFDKFISTEYQYRSEVDTIAIKTMFQEFHNNLMEMIPNDKPPADGYMYNSHMGALCRELDGAKNSFISGLLAYYEKRGSGKTQKS